MLAAICFGLFIGGIGLVLLAWWKGLPAPVNHSRVWQRAKAEAEIRRQLTNAETPSPAGVIHFHDGQYASEAQHDHA